MLTHRCAEGKHRGPGCMLQSPKPISPHPRPILANILCMANSKMVRKLAIRDAQAEPDQRRSLVAPALPLNDENSRAKLQNVPADSSARHATARRHGMPTMPVASRAVPRRRPSFACSHVVGAGTDATVQLGQFRLATFFLYSRQRETAFRYWAPTSTPWSRSIS